MLICDRIKYQNFLISGNHPIEIQLNASPTTLIVGTNGVGKTTLSDAISFAWFGRTLRNLNKPQLVNSVNQHDMLVELAFHNPQAQYVVKRGMKPNIFEIEENGILIPIPARLEDYQTMLETSILKLNYKSFKQIVVLGSDTFTPFMRLPTQQRREIIEDILDIEVFGSMAALNKTDSTELKEKLEQIQLKTRLITEQVKMALSFSEHLEEQRIDALTKVEASIREVNSLILGLGNERTDLTEQYNAVEPVRDAFRKAATKQQEYQTMLRELLAQQKKLTKERAFYDEHDTCPTCEQPITPEFKEERFTSLAQKDAETTEAIQKCQAIIDKYVQQNQERTQTLTDADEIHNSIVGINNKLPLHGKRLKELQAEHAMHSNPLEAQAPKVDVEALQDELKKLNAEHGDLSRKRIVIDAAALILKDNGIKTRIIKHYLPIINKEINRYLNEMDFPILFHLDDTFTERVHSSHRQEFTYESFSSGQKKRIDIALLLAWRAVARIKNSAACNLLFLDEVFDSSLDTGGVDRVLDIIQKLERDTNVFVISHKTDQMIDKFSHTLVFELNRGFSQLKG